MQSGSVSGCEKRLNVFYNIQELISRAGLPARDNGLNVSHLTEGSMRDLPTSIELHQVDRGAGFIGVKNGQCLSFERARMRN